jgi:hypothetical protein
MELETASLLEQSRFLLTNSREIIAELDKFLEQGHELLKQSKSTTLIKASIAPPAIIRL